jgi:hypothetical protein
LAELEAKNTPRLLREAATALVGFTQLAPTRPVAEDAQVGRFEFNFYGDSAEQIAALLRLIRGALDFVEVDFKACAAQEATFHAGQAAIFERLAQ